MEQISHLFSEIVLVILLPPAVESYVSCLRCDDVLSPTYCRQSITCEGGEICFTREIKGQHGQQGYRLGCEVEAICNHSFNANQLIGKRDEVGPYPAPSDFCYECCDGDECNQHLCQGKGGIQTPLRNNASLSCTGCPTFYIPYNNKCCFFATWHLNWTDAREHCRSQSGDLVSINSQGEQEFLVQHLNILRAKPFPQFWTGGAYSHSFQEWEWVDRTPVVYSNWWSGYPVTPSQTSYYHIYMLNPAHPKAPGSFREGRWGTSTTDSFAFICENMYNHV